MSTGYSDSNRSSRRSEAALAFQFFLIMTLSGQAGMFFSHGAFFYVYFMDIVDQENENGIGNGRISDRFLPVLYE
jgi:hypothetical protein